MSKAQSLLYITEAEEGELPDIREAFQSDYSKYNSISNLEDDVNKLCGPDEAATLDRLENGDGYSIQITKPVEKREVARKWRRKPLYITDTPHSPHISELTMEPNNRFDYWGTVKLYDPAGDFKDFAVAIDGEILRTGLFGEHGQFGQLGEFLINTNLKIRGHQELELQSSHFVLERSAYDDGKHCEYGGTNAWGEIPKGKHEFFFYVRDQRGNRSFAVIKYDI